MDTLTTIQNQILDIRGQKVILDRDIAAMYGVETKVLNQAVKRNIDRFPIDFMFQLDVQEVASLKSQIVTLKPGRGQHSKYLPYAFTEHGVAMLSSVLRSPTAVQVNISIIRAFVAMRQMATEIKATPLVKLEQRIDKLALYVEDILKDQNDINDDMQMQLDNISQVIAELQAAQSRPRSRRSRVGFLPPKD